MSMPKIVRGDGKISRIAENERSESDRFLDIISPIIARVPIMESSHHYELVGIFTEWFDAVTRNDRYAEDSFDERIGVAIWYGLMDVHLKHKKFSLETYNTLKEELQKFWDDGKAKVLQFPSKK